MRGISKQIQGQYSGAGNRAIAHADPSGLRFALKAGPYQNNGATQWYATLPIGSPGQTLKLALDTGSNFIWVTSTLCGSTGCVHYGESQFNPQSSSSFAWVSQAPEERSFGPWGTMTVNLGQDILGLPATTVPSRFYLASAYSGSQFAQLDWDGGIGLPSSSADADLSVPPLLSTLLSKGLVDPAFPYISFSFDRNSKAGLAWLGGVDPDAFDPSSGIFMRWSPYDAYSGVRYLWTTALDQMLVGDTSVARNAVFALDSGSSQFKGDNDIMNRTLQLVAQLDRPTVTLLLGAHDDGSQGCIVVPPSVYEVTIEAGPQAGQTLPQFQPLGLNQLVLVGSVLMDHLYTVFEFQATPAGDSYQFSPRGMWLFNKTGGQPLIQSRSSTPAALTRRT